MSSVFVPPVSLFFLSGVIIQAGDVALILGLLCINIIGTQLMIKRYQKWRRTSSTRLQEDEKLLMECDLVPLRFVCDQTVNSRIHENVSLKGKGRIVLSNRRLLVGTSIGRIIEISQQKIGSIRAMGPRRVLLWGHHPTDIGKIRIELALNDEKKWEDAVMKMIKETKPH